MMTSKVFRASNGVRIGFQKKLSLTNIIFKRNCAKTSFPLFQFQNYDTKFSAKIINNGYRVEVRLNGAHNPSVTGGGFKSTYLFDHVHFHCKSEHTVNGKRFPLEIHLVHYDYKFKDLFEALGYTGGVAVFGVLFYLSPYDNIKLNTLSNSVQQLHKMINNEAFTIPNITLNNLLPLEKNAFYRYNKPLEIPASIKDVIWTVFTNHLPISKSQLTNFEAFFKKRDAEYDRNHKILQELVDRNVQLHKSNFWK